MLFSCLVHGSFGTVLDGPTLNQIVADNSSNSLQFVGVTGAFKRIDTKGNPNLQPEEADTINIGLLVDHDALVFDNDNLFVTVDYWSYDFTDPLVTEPFNDLLALACSGEGGACDENGPYFDRLVFGSTNAVNTDIEIINVNIVNGPDIETDGIDFTFRYGLDSGPGRLSFDLTGTKILSYDIGAWEFSGEYDALGRLNYRTSLARTLAEWKGRFTINYEWQDLNVRWIANGVDEYEYGGVAADPDGVVDSHVTHDVHATYNLLDGQLVVSGSIINIEDDDPPDMLREMNYDAFTHNPFGRMYKLGFTYSLGQ